MKNFQYYLEAVQNKKVKIANQSANEELIKIANDLEKTLHCNIHGSCVHFAELFVLAVVEEDDSLLDYFTIIEGYVNTKIGDGLPQAHTWIELKNKTKIDPTFLQFTEWDKNSEYNNTKRRKKYTGQEYHALILKDKSYSDIRNKQPEKIFKNHKVN